MAVTAGEICCVFAIQKVALKRKVKLALQSQELQLLQILFVMMTPQSNYSDF